MKLTAKWRRPFSRQISDNHFCLFRNFSHIVVYFFPRPVSIIYQYRSEPHLLKLKNHYLVLIIPPSNEIYSTNKCRRFYNINVRRPQTVIQKKRTLFFSKRSNLRVPAQKKQNFWNLLSSFPQTLKFLILLLWIWK